MHHFPYWEYPPDSHPALVILLVTLTLAGRVGKTPQTTRELLIFHTSVFWFSRAGPTAYTLILSLIFQCLTYAFVDQMNKYMKVVWKVHP